MKPVHITLELSTVLLIIKQDQSQDQLNKEAIKDLLTFKGFTTTKEVEQNEPQNKYLTFPKTSDDFVRIGESENFIVDRDKTNNTLFLYGKEIKGILSFKLSIKKEEIQTIIELLAKGKADLENN